MKQNPNPSFLIYDASAGSGKTYALERYYLQAVLKTDNPEKILKSKSFKKLVNETLKKLEKHDGRVNVRASGTESMIRIMVESKNKKETQLASKNLANFAKKLT